MRCPECNDEKSVIKSGIQRTKKGNIQRFYCKNCDNYFSDSSIPYTQYREKVIFYAIEQYNKGYPIKEVKKLSEKVRNSERVLIVGGGLIGTEVASELASKTSKRVTLVHSHDRLIERNPKIASYFAEKFLMKKGVNIRFNEKVVDNIDDIFKTNKGNEVEADVCIWSTGLSYDKGLYSDLDEIAIAENGSLSVNESLQVKGYSNIFAGGDITDIKEEKTGHNADSHSKIISENIFRMKENRTLKTYSKLRVPLVISLGDINGILSLPFFGIPGPIPAVIKYLLEKGAILRL